MKLMLNIVKDPPQAKAVAADVYTERKYFIFKHTRQKV